MDFTKFKQKLNHKSVTVVTEEEGNIIGVLTDLDNLEQLLEEHWDLEVKEILSCSVFDYGYVGEISLRFDEDGSTYDRIVTLTVSFLY